MNGFYFYILLCNDGSYYVGHTDNIEQRFAEHQAGRFHGYTSTRLPVKLVYTEFFQTREEAFSAERKVKNWTRCKKEILILHGWDGFKI